MRLRRSPHSVFSNDVEFFNSTSDFHFDSSRIVQGHLEGTIYFVVIEKLVMFLHVYMEIFSSLLDEEGQSEVHGILTKDGLFDGTVHTQHDVSV